MHPILRHLDPRRSLAAAIGWLAFALSIGLVLVASVWVDDIVRTNLLDMRGRQLERTADDFADELNLSFALRLQSARALAAMLATELPAEDPAALEKTIDNLQRASPEFEHIAVADSRGRILAATRERASGRRTADRSWIALGLTAAKIGDVRVVPLATDASAAGSNARSGSAVVLVAPVIDAGGATTGVVGMQLSGRWLLNLVESLEDKLRAEARTEALVLNAQGGVLTGAPGFSGMRLASIVKSKNIAAQKIGINATETAGEQPSHVEQLADGSRYLVAREAPGPSDPLHALGWSVAVLQPLPVAAQSARALQAKITAVLIGVGLIAALLGVFLARRVTRELAAIARSADAVREGRAQHIAVPPGRDEAARLGRALDELLGSLQRERGALKTLNAELDQRVAARTREVERLAEETRYAAVVRERLKLARDLHDTLAHSMMAMLAEIRLLKKLSASNPAALAEELAHAEDAAHQGLKEVRAAIAQMRYNPVRDAGLAAAMSEFVKSFTDRTGIDVEFTSDAQPGTLADERAETLFRIAEEAMRNIERHAGATHVSIWLRKPADGNGLTLTIADNGVGFDPNAAYPGHYGLAGLREQAQLIGAVLTIDSSPQKGTTIHVALAPGHD